MAVPNIAHNELMNIDGRDLAFVFLENGRGVITECNFGRVKRASDKGATEKALFIGNSPVLNMVVQDFGSPTADRLVSSGVGRGRADRVHIDELEKAGEATYNSLGQAVEAIKPILSMLQSGAYIIYYTKLYPTDGAGNFFWSLTGTPRELRGSAKRSRTVGLDKTMIPCFMLPTQHPALYNSPRMNYYREFARNGGTLSGISLHICGMFCAVLDGHHKAAAALLEDVDFHSLVIERLDGFYFDNADATDNKTPTPTGIESMSCRIPFSRLDPDVIKRIMLLRRYGKPRNFYDLRVNYHSQEQSYRGGMWSEEIIKKSEDSPDVDMITSAQTIENLTQPELDALIKGKTTLNGKTIVTPSLYSSVVIASNFLQHTDFNRFIDFSLEVMESEELAATHEYISQRLRRTSDNRVYAFFKQYIEQSKEKPYSEKIIGISKQYVSYYEHDNNIASENEDETE